MGNMARRNGNIHLTKKTIVISPSLVEQKVVPIVLKQNGDNSVGYIPLTLTENLTPPFGRVVAGDAGVIVNFANVEVEPS